jgi:hypothetical protein
MSLRKFIEFGAASRNKVTLRANQTLFISKSIVNKYTSLNPVGCFIFVDDKKPILGIQFVDNIDNNKEIKKISKEKSGFSVNISSVLRFYNIEKRKEKIDMDIVEDKDMLLMDLEKLKKIKNLKA